MKTIPIPLLTSCFALCCAGPQVAANGQASRGAVYLGGPGQKAIVVGPAVIHVYSGFAGGEMYTVPAVSGADEDCRATGAATSPAIRLGADRVVPITVGNGEVACLATHTPHRFELLWHQQKDTTPPSSITVAGRRGQ
jgi:hypothetical protein